MVPKLLLTILFLAIAASEAFVCTKNFCKTAKCEPVKNCSGKNKLILKGSTCMCCDVCYTEVGVNESCDLLFSSVIRGIEMAKERKICQTGLICLNNKCLDSKGYIAELQKGLSVSFTSEITQSIAKFFVAIYDSMCIYNDERDINFQTKNMLLKMLPLLALLFIGASQAFWCRPGICNHRLCLPIRVCSGTIRKGGMCGCCDVCYVKVGLNEECDVQLRYRIANSRSLGPTYTYQRECSESLRCFDGKCVKRY